MIEISKEKWDQIYASAEVDIKLVGEAFKDARAKGDPIDSDFLLMTAADRYHKVTEPEEPRDHEITFESSLRIVDASVVVFLAMEEMTAENNPL